MSILRDETVWLLGRLEYAERRASGEELFPRELQGFEGKGVKDISVTQDEVVRRFLLSFRKLVQNISLKCPAEYHNMQVSLILLSYRGCRWRYRRTEMFICGLHITTRSEDLGPQAHRISSLDATRYARSRLPRHTEAKMIQSNRFRAGTPTLS